MNYEIMLIDRENVTKLVAASFKFLLLKNFMEKKFSLQSITIVI